MPTHTRSPIDQRTPNGPIRQSSQSAKSLTPITSSTKNGIRISQLTTMLRSTIASAVQVSAENRPNFGVK